MTLDRRMFLLAGLAALSACGFTPVHGPGGAGTALTGAVLVDEPVTRDGYLLTRALEDRLGRANPGRYGLSFGIDLSRDSSAISRRNVTTRVNLLADATYALRDLESQEVVASGRIDTFTSYSASGTPVATQAAEEDARKRLMSILADQIVTRLVVAAPASPR